MSVKQIEFICEKCGKKMVRKINYLKHIKSCKTSNCLECGENISSKKKFCNLSCFGKYNSKIKSNLPVLKNLNNVENTICIDCNKEFNNLKKNRCTECYKKYNRKRVKKYFNENKDRIYKKGICPICKKEMTIWRDDQLAHRNCKAFTQGDYNKFLNKSEFKTHGRKFVEDLGIDIPKGYVVHHIDENPMNNSYENLIICSLKHHNQLHQKFNKQRTILLRDFENCDVEELFKPYRKSITESWVKENKNEIILVNNCEN